MSHRTASCPATERRRSHAPTLAPLTLILLALGGHAAWAPDPAAAATCPDDSKRDDARVQLWSDSGCEGSTVSVGLGDPQSSDRPDFTSFTGTDGSVWFDGRTSSFAVAEGSCLRLFENTGYTGESYPLACAPSGTRIVSEVGAFDNRASSMRVCSALIPSDCDPPAPAPPSPAPPPAGSPAGPDCTATATTPGLHLRAGARGVMTTRSSRPLVTGRLTRADGSPLAGAALCVETKGTVPGASPAIAGAVTTDADGRFTHRLAPGGSRRVTFVFKGQEGAASDSVLVRVRAPVSLRASERTLRNGQILGLRGQAPGDTGRGLLVEIQARRSSGWQTFATTRTRRRGGFRFAYQFTRTLGVRVYRLRARVPFQPTLPYAPGASRTVRVRVAG